MKELLGNGLDTIVSQALQEMKEEQTSLCCKQPLGLQELHEYGSPERSFR